MRLCTPPRVRCAKVMTRPRSGSVCRLTFLLFDDTSQPLFAFLLYLLEERHVRVAFVSASHLFTFQCTYTYKYIHVINAICNMRQQKP